LLRTLPKTVRRDLGPADTHAARFLAAASNGPLIPQLASFFEVPIDAWRVDTLPAHLRMTFRVIGADGKAIAAGPDLPALQRRFAVAARGAIATATGWQDHLGQKAWTFGALPRVVSKGNIRGYPSLVDEGATVGAVLWPTPEDQAREMWAGTARLLALSVSLGNDTRARLTNEARLALTRAGYRNASEVLDDCLVAAVDRGLALHGGPVWSPEEYSALAASVRDEVAHLGPAVVGFVSGILVLTARLHQRLDRLIAPALIDAATDMREQIEALVYPRFAQTAGPARLPDVLRYLRAVDRRLDTLAKSPERDRARMEQIRALAARYERAAVSSAAPAAEQIAVRWMLEELRVSEFAQTLGTPAPISAKRVDAAIRALVSR
jgi:ATP-dependent helicase HrpA